MIRHFLLETVEEINNYLIKNNKAYRVNFKDETYEYFANENEEYLKENKFCNEDDTINEDKLNDRINYFHNLVRLCSFSDKLYLMPKESEITSEIYQLLI